MTDDKVDTFDMDTYRQLLLEVCPQVIQTEEEYDRLLAIAERYVFCEDNTPEESALLRLLGLIIEQYEDEQYPMDSPEPHEILQHIMESSGTTEYDLAQVLGGGRGTEGLVREIVSGQAAITKAQAIALGAHFKVSPNLFAWHHTSDGGEVAT